MAHSAHESALRGRRVLIVEDEMLMAMELDSLLRDQGCTVLGPAATVKKAIALITEERPDAALLDLNLNGQPAIPVAAELNRQGVPFLIVSGYSKTHMQAPELSRARRLPKPVERQRLLGELGQLLG